MTNTCVLFDFEGTLVDFQWQLQEGEAALRATLGEAGFEPSLFAADNYAAMRHRALRLAADDVARAEIDRRLGPVYDRFDLDALRRWSLREGAKEVLGALRGAGVRVGLVTNIGRQAIDRALERFQLSTALDTVVTRNEVTWMKPEAEGILRALESLKRPTVEAMMVGDSLSDLYAARNAGVRVAIILGGESSPDEIAAHGPDHTLARLADVAALVLPGGG